MHKRRTRFGLGTCEPRRGRHLSSNKINREMGTFLSSCAITSMRIAHLLNMQGLGSLWRVVVDRCNSTVKQREQWIKLGMKYGLRKDQIACVRIGI